MYGVPWGGPFQICLGRVRILASAQGERREELAMCFLTEPSTQYKDQYIAALREFQREGKHLNEDIGRIASNFDEFVQRARDMRDRTKVPPNLVPMTDYWLVEDGEFIERL